MADALPRPINWTNVFNVCCCSILVGAETIGAGAAAGWAIAGITRLGEPGTTIALSIGAVCGAVAMVFFFRAAKRVEPFR